MRICVFLKCLPAVVLATDKQMLSFTKMPTSTKNFGDQVEVETKQNLDSKRYSSERARIYPGCKRVIHSFCLKQNICVVSETLFFQPDNLDTCSRAKSAVTVMKLPTISPESRICTCRMLAQCRKKKIDIPCSLQG